ncbi:MAG: serine--tRNA ligase, partial [Gammaproteobacteria bacterium]|nr:serine--tRNA ligase [Gammaproteobacteria bacterium]
MLDAKLLRTDLQSVKDRLAHRGFKLDMSQFEELESRRKSVQENTQKLQAERNSKSKQIGIAKSKGEDASAIMQEVSGLGDKLKAQENELKEIQSALSTLMLGIPNLPHDSVPIGKSEEENV